MPCDDCSRTENCPPCPYEVCKCHHERRFHKAEGCLACTGQRLDILARHQFMEPEEPEPPLTPEEEEEVAEDDQPAPCKGCGEPWHKGHECPPPQPDRRPPFAVNYAVQGHLYQVAVPGDASVRAVDGALVIQHHLGPVAGIVQVLPIITEEAPHGAEADQ